MTDLPSFLNRVRAPAPPRRPTLDPLMYADPAGQCRDCHARPVVPYHPRCQHCIVAALPRKPNERD